jgi:hypothetical protein
VTGPPAHVGHWIVNLLYVAPVLAVVIALVVQRLRGRDEETADGDEG